MKIPKAFIDSLQNIKGFNEITFNNAVENEESPNSIRINPFKKTAKFDDAEPVIWSEYGKYLTTSINSDSSPLYHAGTYFEQEASSMYLEQILKNNLDLSEDLKVLDLCGNTGGKSTLIASLLTPDSLLISNDMIKARANTLADNLTKWGTMNTVVTNNEPRDFMRLSGFFDVIIIDAPSSRSGLFRKEPSTIKEWSLDNVKSYSSRQKNIIIDAWSSLKQNGILVYSTCSFSKEENEDIVNWIQEEFSVEHLIPRQSQENLLGNEIISEGSFRFYPDKVKGEGFFITAFQKKSSEKEVFIRSGKPIKNNNRRTEREIFRNWIDNIDNYTWLEKNEDYFLINPAHEHAIYFFQTFLNVRKAGVKLGKLSSKDLIPDHELALSFNLSEKINRIELTEEEAIKYLSRVDFSLNQSIKGWSLMTFQHFGLGWAKILPNRVNNYFPKEQKIQGK